MLCIDTFDDSSTIRSSSGMFYGINGPYREKTGLRVSAPACSVAKTTVKPDNSNADSTKHWP